MIKNSATAIFAVFALALSGCANQSGARMGLLSASAPVLAVLYNDLFIGKAVGYIDGSGTIQVVSVVNKNLQCVGEFRYTGAHTGEAHLNCNDGTVAQLSFVSLSAISGYGYGRTSRGPASFTYGLTVKQAAGYLKLPEGKRLVSLPSGPGLASL